MSRKDYVKIRIGQLEEDKNKASKDYDKQWYNRIINELQWAESALLGLEMKDCGLPFRHLETTLVGNEKK